jgi:tRNA pseudouridine38-40 synthase
MVRLLVGTMIACLDGKLTLSQLTDMIMNKMSEKAKYIAPACGLFLADVGYERGIG